MKDKKTKYRIAQNGYDDRWLEYRRWFGWEPVPEPYWDRITGREYTSPYVGRIRSRFENFIKKYPSIKTYFDKVYNPQQEELEKDSRDYWVNFRKKENEVIDL